MPTQFKVLFEAGDSGIEFTTSLQLSSCVQLTLHFLHWFLLIYVSLGRLQVFRNRPVQKVGKPK